MAQALLVRLVAVIKLTRLNHQIVAINPDHLVAAEASPDTTLFLMSGDKLLVRESLDELIERVIEYRRAVRTPFQTIVGLPEGDLLPSFERSSPDDGHDDRPLSERPHARSPSSNHSPLRAARGER